MTPDEARLIALRNRQKVTGPPAGGARAQATPQPQAHGDLRSRGVPHPRPNTVHVQINAASGDVTFHPTTIHIAGGQSVSFAYMNGGPFTIHFRGRSPFPGGRASLHSKGGRIVSPPLPQGAAGQRFQYEVMARVAHGAHQGKIAHGEGGVLAVTQ